MLLYKNLIIINILYISFSCQRLNKLKEMLRSCDEKTECVRSCKYPKSRLLEKKKNTDITHSLYYDNLIGNSLCDYKGENRELRKSLCKYKFDINNSQRKIRMQLFKLRRNNDLIKEYQKVIDIYESKLSKSRKFVEMQKKKDEAFIFSCSSPQLNEDKKTFSSGYCEYLIRKENKRGKQKNNNNYSNLKRENQNDIETDDSKSLNDDDIFVFTIPDFDDLDSWINTSFDNAYDNLINLNDIDIEFNLFKLNPLFKNNKKDWNKKPSNDNSYNNKFFSSYSQQYLKQNKAKEDLIACYKILGLDENATPNQIKKEFKRLAKKFHPDRNIDDKENAADKFIKISKAYDKLKKKLKFN